MAKYSNTVEYQIRTTLDSSGIAKLKAELATLQNSLVSKNAQGLIPDNAFRKTMADIKQVDSALTKAFNGKLGMLDIKKFNSELTKGNQTLNSYYKSFSSLGSQGTRAFGQMYGQLTKIDTGMKQVSSTTDKIANTFGNTFRWGVIASMFSGIMNSIHQSVQYVKDLDKSLTNIQMVTASSREAMNDFAVQANEAAKMLGGTTVQMTNATEVFIRQGHSLQTATQLGEYAVHLANVSGQDSAMASDEITAYMNAFHISVDDIGNAVSKWAAVANNAAVSVEELSVASQKAAAVATTVGVDMDQFAAHIAAIEATTREAPENIGNGLKTLYSRIADISLGETLEDGVNMGSFAKAIEKVGVEVLDDAGKLRDAGDIIHDLMGVWQDLDQTQRAALAKTVAGRFQLARFEALMNSADIYEKSLKTSQMETGTEVYDRMQETYRNSMEGRLNALSATIEGIFTKAFDTDDFYGLIDAATLLAETFDNLIQSIGGGSNALLGLGAIITKVFSKNIAQGIGNSVLNRQTNQLAKENLNTQIGNAKAQLRGQGLNTDNQYMNNMANNIAKVQQYMGNMSQEQLDKLNASAQKHIGIMSEAAVAEKEFQSVLEAVEIGIKAEEVSLEGAVTVEERYAIALKEMAQAKADGVSYNLQESEMYQALTSDVEKLARGLITLTNAFENNVKAGNINADTLKQMQTQAAGLNGIIKELIESEKLDEERVKELSNAQKILTQIEQGQITNSAELAEALNKISLSEEHFLQTLKNLNVNGKDAQIILEQLKIRFEQTAAAAEVSAKEMQGMAEMGAVQNLANNISNIASGAMSVIFAFQSIRSAFEALNNDELNPFEKIEQTLMGLSMAAMMTIPVIMQLRGAYLDLSAAESANIIAKKFNNITDIQANAILEKSIEEKAHFILVTKAANAATKEEKAAVLASVVAKKTYTQAEVAAIAKVTGLTVAEVEQTLVTNGATVATIGLGNALSTMGKKALAAAASFAAGHPILLAIVGVITATVVALKFLWDAYNADAVAAEKAAEKAAKLNKEWKDSQQRLDDLVKSLEELEDIDNAFDKLIKGTQEWNDKLKENNDLVLKLIEAYPELAKEVTRSNDGQLEISTSGQNQLKQRLENAERNARNAAYTSQILSSQASLRNEETNTARKISQSGTWNADRVDILADYMIKNNKSSAELDAIDIRTALSDQGITDTAIDSILKSINKNGEYLDQIANKKENTKTAERTVFDEIMQQEMGEDYLSLAEADKQKLFDKYIEALSKADVHMSDKDLASWFAENHGYLQNSIRQQDGAWVMKNINGEESDPFTRAEMEDSYKTKTILPDIVDEAKEMGKRTEQLTYDFGVLGKALQINTEETNKNSKSKSSPFNYDTGHKISVNGQQITRIPNDVSSNNDQNQGYSIAKNEAGQAIIDVSGMTEAEVTSLVNKINDMSPEDFKNFADSIGYATKEQLLVAIYGDSDKYAELVAGSVTKGLEAIENTHLNPSQWAEKLGIDENQFQYVQQNFENMSNPMKDWKTAIDDTSVSLDQQKEKLEENIKTLERKLKTDNLTVVEQSKLGLELQGARNQLEKVNKQIEKNENDTENYNEIIDDLAGKYAESTEGLNTLIEKWESWNKVLSSGNEVEKAKTFGEIAEALGQLTHQDASMFDANFITENFDLIEQAANNSYEAIYQLRMEAAKKIWIDAGLTTQAEGIPSEFSKMINALYSAAESAHFELGATLDASQVIDAFATMLATGEYTVEEITAFTQSLSALGIEADVNYAGVAAAATRVLTSIAKAMGAPDAVIQAIRNTAAENVKSVLTYRVVGDAGNDWSSHAGSSGGSGGSGGGGGGGGSSFSATEKETPKNEKDPYEKVNTTLNKIDTQLTDLNKQQDKLPAGGQKWLKVLEQESDVLKRQKFWLQEKQKVNKQELQRYKDELATLSKDNNIVKPEYSPEGQLKNYLEMWEAYNKNIQDAYTEYNNAVKKQDEKGTEKWEAEIQKREKALQDFTSAYQAIDQLYSQDIPELAQAIKDIDDAIADLGTAAVKARRDSAKALNDWNKDYNDMWKTLKNINGQHINIDIKYNNKEWKRIVEDTNSEYEKWKLRQQDIQRMRKEFEKSTDGSYTVRDANGETYKSTDEQALRDWEKELLDDYSSIVSEIASLIQDSYQSLDDLTEHMNDNLDDVLNKYETINDQVQYIQDMYELRHGDRIGQSLIDAANYQAKVAVGTKDALNASKTYYENMVAQYNYLLSQDPKNIEYQNRLREAREKVAEIDAQILEQNQAIVEAYKEARDLSNQLALQNWTDQFRGQNGVPLSYAADQWERIKENEALYLDDLNKSYETQKLQNKYQDLLNNATDPSIQREITKQMQEQLKYLREKDKLSKYDVDYANAQLEILQKRIALEDAQAAKNTMKLRRDSQGNYQYVYATNQSDVAKAQNELLDAEMNAYNMSKNHQREMQDNIISGIQKMADNISKVMTDNSLTEEQRKSLLEEIRTSGNYYLDSQAEQLSDSQQKMIQSFIDAAEDIEKNNQTQAVQNLLEKMNLEEFDEKVDQTFNTFIKTWLQELQNGTYIFSTKGSNDGKDLQDKINSNWISYEKNIANAFKEGKILGDIDKVIKTISEKITGNISETETAAKNLGTILKDDKKQIDSLIESLKDWANQIKDIESQVGTKNSSIDTIKAQGTKDENQGTAAPVSPKNLNFGVGDLVKYGGDNKNLYWDTTDTYKVISKNPDDSYTIQALTAKNPKTGLLLTGNVKKSEITKVKTGGYTGTWFGADTEENGRLAFLHQKELVLNATDTENILAAVDSVRTITNQLKNIGLITGIGSIGRIAQNSINGNNIEQRVEITANFPNVNSAAEIQNALLNLSNTAYQYAYNKNNIPW